MEPETPRPTILVVDDQANIRALLRLYLEQAGYRVEEAADGETALRRITASPPDLLILDLMLPRIDGWELCRRLRADEQSALPILMLTARDDDVDKIVGLELGADDYVTKPFNPREVVARVRAILRRARPSPLGEEKGIHLGDVHLDPRRRELTIAGHPVKLRRREFDLLHALMRQPRVVFSREQLLDQVWGYDFPVQTRTVDVHIAALRRHLRPSRLRIETVPGIGYRLVLLEGEREP